MVTASVSALYVIISPVFPSASGLDGKFKLTETLMFDQHAEFETFVLEAGRGLVEFFDIGGDPRDLMAYMVKSAFILSFDPTISRSPRPSLTTCSSKTLDSCPDSR